MVAKRVVWMLLAIGCLAEYSRGAEAVPQISRDDFGRLFAASLERMMITAAMPNAIMRMSRTGT